MNGLDTSNTLLWPFFVYGMCVLALLTFIISLSYFLGQRHKDRATGQPYESGIMETGSARLQFSAQFYLVAMMFVIFDIEVVFIILWALAFDELGWHGYLGICIFIGLLLVVLLYEWRLGALDFGPNAEKILNAYRKLVKKKPSV